MAHKQKHRGDDGTTGIAGEKRIPKYHPCIDVLGALDEASAAIGLARSLTKNDRIIGILIEAQKQLYLVMADFAQPLEEKPRINHLSSIHLEWINSTANGLEAQIELPSQFILPGDSTESAALSLARTVVRRAEREVVEYLKLMKFNAELILPWLNRLSHLLFLLEVSTSSDSGGKPTLVK